MSRVGLCFIYKLVGYLVLAKSGDAFGYSRHRTGCLPPDYVSAAESIRPGILCHAEEVNDVDSSADLDVQPARMRSNIREILGAGGIGPVLIGGVIVISARRQWFAFNKKTIFIRRRLEVQIACIGSFDVIVRPRIVGPPTTWMCMRVCCGFMGYEGRPTPEAWILLTITSLVVPLIAVLGGPGGANVFDAIHQLGMVQKLGGNFAATHGATSVLVRNALEVIVNTI